MRLTAMTYNLMRVFEEVSKIQDPTLMHPSDKKYTKALEKRDRSAKKKVVGVSPEGLGRSINPTSMKNKGTLIQFLAYTQTT